MRHTFFSFSTPSTAFLKKNSRYVHSIKTDHVVLLDTSTIRYDALQYKLLIRTTVYNVAKVVTCFVEMALMPKH